MKFPNLMLRISMLCLLLTPLLLAAGKQPVKEKSCFELGKMFGRCGYTAFLGKKCAPADDIVKPKRCMDISDFDLGIKEGIQEVVNKSK